MADDTTTEGSRSDQRTDDDDVASFRVDGLTHRYGSLTVFEKLAIEFPSGTATALVGPNGSGKTTLLEVLVGVRTPARGIVHRPAAPAGRTVGYLPQEPSFRNGFTVRETIEQYQRLVGTDPAPDRALAPVGLDGVADRTVEELSGGMTRLLGIAQASVGNPPAIVFDEPTSGLDPGVKTRVFEALERLASDGAAVVFSSHDLDGVQRHADRLALLAGGDLHGPASTGSLCDRHSVESVHALYHSIVEEDHGPVGGGQ